MIRRIKEFFKEKTKPILFFSERAKKEIQSHLKGIDSGSVLVFSVKTDKKGKRQILSGFDKAEKISKQYKVDGLPIEFRGKSKEILEGSGVDWSKDGNILVYPQIDLHSEDTPNPHIIAFISNKNFISENSALQSGAWEKNEGKNMPSLVKSLFQRKYIHSIYLYKNRIQIEINPKYNWKTYEEEVASDLLDYLESLPSPIYLVDVL